MQILTNFIVLFHIFKALMTLICFYLLSGFLPSAVNFLRQMPVIGTILSLPGIRQVIKYFQDTKFAL